MKLHYSKTLLFSLPLNILLTSSSNEHNNNNNEPHSTPRHTPRYTSRVLSEGDTQSSIYDNDEDMKSVKENFHRQTSQRLREYDERMQYKRQKRKEERDKNIEQVIKKDKMEISLAEKVEKGCLRCGCVLGGVAASVGIFGTVAVKDLTKAAITAAEITAKNAAMVDAAAKGIEAFKSAVIEGITREFGVSIQGVQGFQSLFTSSTYPSASQIASVINDQYRPSSCISLYSVPRSSPVAGSHNSICTWWGKHFLGAREIPWNVSSQPVSETALVKTHVSEIVTRATARAGEVTNTTIEEAIKARTLAAESTYAGSQTAIIASVVAIIIIALVMIIIYLVLRYRRKKKMKKKAEYTKLLKE